MNLHKEHGKDRSRPKVNSKLVRKSSERIRLINEKLKEAKKRKFVELENPSETEQNVKRRRVGSLDSCEIEENKSSKSALNGLILHSPKKQFPVFTVGKQKTNNMTCLRDVNLKCNEKESVVENNTCRPRNDEVDGELLDQNLNNISSCIKSESLQQLYEKKLLGVDSSPFKGKLSAFEISLLKGKQNLERRKSLESASLRSSPRTNKTNYRRPNYSDKRRSKARLSLDTISEKNKNTQISNTEKIDKLKSKKRKRTSSNKETKSEDEQISGAQIDEKMNKFDSFSKPLGQFKYRMNGAKKRSSLPAKLALTSISLASGSTSQQQQGKSSSLKSAKTSCQRFCPKQVSGKKPTVSEKLFNFL